MRSGHFSHQSELKQRSRETGHDEVPGLWQLFPWSKHRVVLKCFSALAKLSQMGSVILFHFLQVPASSVLVNFSHFTKKQFGVINTLLNNLKYFLKDAQISVTMSEPTTILWVYYRKKTLVWCVIYIYWKEGQYILFNQGRGDIELAQGLTLISSWQVMTGPSHKLQSWSLDQNPDLLTPITVLYHCISRDLKPWSIHSASMAS